MPRRPAIPAEIRRQVALECGHRCAACGRESSLEFAHIVPWHRCNHHESQNIILLCLICHKKAHREKWTKETLRWYKQNPAVQRYFATEELARAGEVVTLRIEIRVADFRERDRWLLRLALAELLKTTPESVLISRLEEGGDIALPSLSK